VRVLNPVHTLTLHLGTAFAAVTRIARIVGRQRLGLLRLVVCSCHLRADRMLSTLNPSIFLHHEYELRKPLCER